MSFETLCRFCRMTLASYPALMAPVSLEFEQAARAVERMRTAVGEGSEPEREVCRTAVLRIVLLVAERAPTH